MIKLSVLKRKHISMEFPEGYIDAMQSDSESVNDPLYIQEEQNGCTEIVPPQCAFLHDLCDTNQYKRSCVNAILIWFPMVCVLICFLNPI